MATAVLRNGPHPTPENRFVITGHLARGAVDAVQAAVRPDPQSVPVLRIRCRHGALTEAARVSSLVAKRPEPRTPRLEAIHTPGLGRRPDAAFTVTEQPDDKISTQSVGIVRIALIPDGLLAVPGQLHQAQCVRAKPECSVLILLNGHHAG